MQVLRYPPGTLVGDYLRAGAGVGVGVGVLAVNPTSWPLLLVFGGVAGLFGVFGARTAERHITRVGVDSREIARAGLGTRRIAWDSIDRVRLRYYGTRRQQRGEGGFYQLTLGGDGAKMVFESNLEGFDFLVWRAAKAARENRVSVDPGTAGNMLDLGLDADGEHPPPQPVAEMARRVDSGGGDAPDPPGSRRSA